METYEGYQISRTVQTDSSNVYRATNLAAKAINSIGFSHYFLFQYCENNPDSANCTVNGKPAKSFEEGVDNYYQATLPKGIVISYDFKKFELHKKDRKSLNDCSPIDAKDLQKLI
ncbi:hypothetical protein EZS27_004092 [termite gut metagenome]|uniref:Uncharacterized protein n=1 Tax=termite gut metagenome TaxID=433724 RepID=A0A5J4SRP0_9ZZZZ